MGGNSGGGREFYKHEGFDVKAIKNAIKYDLEKKESGARSLLKDFVHFDGQIQYFTHKNNSFACRNSTFVEQKMREISLPLKDVAPF